MPLFANNNFIKLTLIKSFLNFEGLKFWKWLEDNNMAKIAMNIEGTFVFETVMRVRNTEIDISQHLTIESLVSILSEARARFFYSKGIKEINAEYQGLMISDITVDYVSRARAREELLVEVGTQNISEQGGNFTLKVSRMYDSSVVATAVMGFIMHDYRSNKTIALPQNIRQLLEIVPFDL